MVQDIRRYADYRLEEHERSEEDARRAHHVSVRDPGEPAGARQGRGRQGRRGPGEGRRAAADRGHGTRPRPAGGASGHRQDTARAGDRLRARSRLQPCPVHAGHHPDGARRRERHACGRDEVREGHDLHQRAPRGRDQPHPAAHAGCAARGDGRAEHHRRGSRASPARPVPRDRDAEPVRAGGRLPAPGVEPRPVPLQGLHRLHGSRARGRHAPAPAHRRHARHARRDHAAARHRRPGQGPHRARRHRSCPRRWPAT